MTTSPFQSFCDSVMRAVVTASNDPSWFQAPVYRYGQRFFDTTEGKPPAIRWTKDSTATLAASNSGVGRATKGGEIGGFEQPFRCRVWGADEATTYELFLMVVEPAKRLANHVDDVGVEWIGDDGNNHTKGAMLEFSITAKVPAPKRTPTLAHILTASAINFRSDAIPTSSYAYDTGGTLWKDSVITGSL